MKYREMALTEIYERLKENHEALGITSFRRTPTSPVTKEMLPCIHMFEGTDNIVKHGSRNKTGYPANRVLEVPIEIITPSGVDIKSMYNGVRRALFTERGSSPVAFNPILAPNTFINENRTEGPTGYGLEDFISMVLVLDLVYTDSAFFTED